MVAQTSYSATLPVALPGVIHSIGPDEIISRAAEGTIAFGIAVSRGTDPDNQAILGGTAFSGISIRSLEREGAAGTGLVDYQDTETVGIMRDGYIWAICPTGCVPGNAVNYVNATGVLDSGAAVAGETAIDDASWETTAAAGQLGVIRLDGLNTTAGV